jgi:hypothetical protein
MVWVIVGLCVLFAAILAALVHFVIIPLVEIASFVIEVLDAMFGEWDQEVD